MTHEMPLNGLTPSFAKSLGYWNGLRHGRRTPTLQSLDPFFSAALTEWVIAVDVSAPPKDYVFWSVGASLAPYLPKLAANQRLADVFESPEKNKIWQTFIEVAKHAAPYWGAFEYFGDAEGVLSSRGLFLPFRRPESDIIDDILVFVEFTDAPVPLDVLGSSQCKPALPTPKLSRLEPVAEAQPAPNHETHGAGTEG